jgi:hypothetical protein
MKRTINYTGRKRIKKENISINIIKNENNTLYFSVNELDLKELNINTDAKVYIEAYYRTDLKRFDLGNIHNIKTPIVNDISDLVYIANIKFRVIVVDPSDGKILAHIDNISIGKNVLLRVEIKDLNNNIWMIEYDNDGPILCLNNKIPNIINIVKNDPQFFMYVFPSVIREILTYIFFVDDYDPETNWHSNWLTFTKHLIFATPTILDKKDDCFDKDEVNEWINNVATEFTNKYKSKYQEYVKNLESVK